MTSRLTHDHEMTPEKPTDQSRMNPERVAIGVR